MALQSSHQKLSCIQISSGVWPTITLVFTESTLSFRPQPQREVQPVHVSWEMPTDLKPHDVLMTITEGSGRQAETPAPDQCAVRHHPLKSRLFGRRELWVTCSPFFLYYCITKMLPLSASLSHSQAKAEQESSSEPGLSMFIVSDTCSSTRKKT